MRDKKTAHKVFVGKAGGKKPLGRYKRKVEILLKWNLKK
jgi:hypothetical protein